MAKRADSWKQHTNQTIRRLTGYELIRASSWSTPGRSAAPRADRRMTAPVFVMCSVRSGSTLLRVILDSHSQIYAPHELHLKDLRVDLSNQYVEGAMDELGVGQSELEHMLWDRLLEEALIRSGKRILVNKTPDDVFIWRRIVQNWPDARFIFLLRHPAAITRSWHSARSWDMDEATDSALRYMEAVEEVRRTLPGITVRYEELTAEPEDTTRRLCEFLGVEWEAQMLDYGGKNHGSLKAGLGDWTSKIRSGRIQQSKPIPTEIPPRLKDICEAWGYVR
jgi:LPS sulfotransferase NodH